MVAMRILYFQLTLSIIEFIQSKLCYVSLIKGDDPYCGEEFD